MTSDFYRPHGHPHKETRIARSQVRWVWCMGPPLQAPHLQRWEKFIWIARGRCGNGRTGALQQWCSNSRESPKSTATTRCKLGQSVNFASIDMGNQDESSVCCTLFVQDEGYYIVGVHLSSPIIVWIFNGVIRLQPMGV